MLSKNSRRLAPEVNASSMADIAFLLLVFFLITTEISVESGLLVQLPVWDDDPPPVVLNEDNVLSVKVNAANQLLLRGEEVEITLVRERAKAFILNPDRRPDFPDKPTKAVLSLQNDRSTNYATYLAVYNELLAAYHEIWDADAQHNYGVSYAELTDQQRTQVRRRVPLVLSEAEPTNYSKPTR